MVEILRYVAEIIAALGGILATVQSTRAHSAAKMTGLQITASIPPRV